MQETETGRGYHLLVLEGEEDPLQGGWGRPFWVRDTQGRDLKEERVDA